MRKKRKLAFVAGILASICMVGGIAFVRSNEEVSAATQYEWSGDKIESVYRYGTVFSVPNRTIGNGENRVMHSLVLPDGSATYADSIQLTQSGTYVLTYTTVIEGQAYSERYEFTVKNMTYTVSNPASTLAYATPENMRPIQTTDAEGNPTTVADESKALIVGLAKDDVLHFNQLISIDNFTAENNFIEGLIIPEEMGASGFARFTITLTDAENPDIYLNITINGRAADDGSYGQSFASAGGNGQDMVGVQTGGSGEYQKHFTNDGYGQTLYLPFDGKMSIPYWGGVPAYTYETYANDYPFRLNLDLNSMELWNIGNYVNAIGGVNYDQSVPTHKDNTQVTTTDYRKFITEFDNPTYYNTLWNGFESKYVKLSIKADKYNADLAKFAITKVAGIDLSQESFEIESKPEITVQNLPSDVPEAKVGEYYPIFDATAYDLNSGKVEVKTNVWYNYSSDNKTAAKVVDGRFYAENPGYYAIVYTATNSVGLTEEKVVWVHASSDVPAISIAFDGTQETNVKVGSFVTYANAMVSGGSGDVSVKVYAKHTESGEILATEKGFRPERTGAWEVICEAVDFIGQTTTQSYEVNVESNDVPVLVNDIVLPKVFVSGGKYTLPEIYGNKYTADGAQPILCQVEVTDANGTVEYVAGEQYTAKVNANGDTVNVKYICDGTKLYEEDISATIIYTDGVLDYGRLFISDNATGKKSESGYMLTANAGATELSYFYANTVVANGLDVNLYAPIDTATYDEIALTLIDAADYNNAITATLKEVDGKVTFIVGDKMTALAYAFGDVALDLAISYDNGAFTFANLSFPVATNDLGEKFEGFTSDKVYVQVMAKNATAGAQLKTVSIRGYLFRVQENDVIKPYIVNPYSGLESVYGENYILPAVSVGDMISPSVKTTMVVTAPDGSVVSSVDGVELNSECNPFVDYEITLSQTGSYTVAYTVVEDNEFDVRQVKSLLSYSIDVPDSVSPTISFTSAYKAMAKVGDILTMPDFTVEDNVDSMDDMIIYVYVINPNGMLQSLDCNKVNGELAPLDRNSITCSMSGVYAFHIMAIDSCGNITVEKISITVE